MATEIARQANVLLAFEPEVNLKVTKDAANIFHAGELARMREALDEAFALSGTHQGVLGR